jgi:electron transfer flavoprotein beta subunit
MDIIVPIRFVPDLVDELEIDPDTGRLDCTFMRRVPGEMDEHAVEQAILLKERTGATVTVVAPDVGDVDEALFTAAAKGADSLVKVAGDGLEEGTPASHFARIVAGMLEGRAVDLVLSATAAIDDLDGGHAAMLAAELGLPYVGYVTGVEVADGKALVRKEYPGGLLQEVEVDLPAVIGIQAAEEPPRYVVTSLVMQAMKEATVDVVDSPLPPPDPGSVAGLCMRLPEKGAGAELLDGSSDEVAEALIRVLKDRGVIA